MLCHYLLTVLLEVTPLMFASCNMGHQVHIAHASPHLLANVRHAVCGPLHIRGVAQIHLFWDLLIILQHLWTSTPTQAPFSLLCFQEGKPLVSIICQFHSTGMKRWWPWGGSQTALEVMSLLRALRLCMKAIKSTARHYLTSIESGCLVPYSCLLTTLVGTSNSCS